MPVCGVDLDTAEEDDGAADVDVDDLARSSF